LREGLRLQLENRKQFRAKRLHLAVQNRNLTNFLAFGLGAKKSQFAGVFTV
jgi:hypothetical protein